MRQPVRPDLHEDGQHGTSPTKMCTDNSGRRKRSVTTLDGQQHEQRTAGTAGEAFVGGPASVCHEGKAARRLESQGRR